MPLDQLILSYVIALLATLAALATYAELRRRRFEPPASEDNIFRCKKCGHVYTDDPDMPRSRCAQCGQMNEVFRF